MDYSIYALRVASAPETKQAVADYLGHAQAPQSVRVATLIPISNQGWPSDAIGSLLRLDQRGALVGAEEPAGVPQLLIPWQNIAYLADGLEDI